MGALIGCVEGIEVKKGWLPPDSAVPVLDIYLVERNRTRMFIAASFTIDKS